MDNESKNVIHDSLESLIQNRTTFVIAHRLSTVRNAKRILVLTDDGVGEKGTHEKLLAAGKTYTHVYNMQAQI